MSDPMTNNDIEDVLSSIRRLVSQDHTDMSSSARPEPAQDGGAVSGRLLLTPALRVAEANENGGASPSGMSERSAAENADVTAGEQAVPDAGMPNDASESRASLEKTIAELEEAVSIYEEEWEPDGSEAAAAPPVDSEGPERLPEAPPPEHEAYPSMQTEPARPFEVEMSDTEEPGDSEITAQQGHPDNVWPFTAAGKAAPDAAAAEAPARDSAAVGNSAATTAAASFSEPEDEGELEAVLDEETLRDLVAEIVREELQGELGERITRNVRKLVRSEIARTLASRALEQ